MAHILAISQEIHELKRHRNGIQNENVKFSDNEEKEDDIRRWNCVISR